MYVQNDSRVGRIISKKVFILFLNCENGCLGTETALRDSQISVRVISTFNYRSPKWLVRKVLFIFLKLKLPVWGTRLNYGLVK